MTEPLRHASGDHSTCPDCNKCNANLRERARPSPALAHECRLLIDALLALLTDAKVDGLLLGLGSGDVESFFASLATFAPKHRHFGQPMNARMDIATHARNAGADEVGDEATRCQVTMARLVVRRSPSLKWGCDVTEEVSRTLLAARADAHDRRIAANREQKQAARHLLGAAAAPCVRSRSI